MAVIRLDTDAFRPEHDPHPVDPRRSQGPRGAGDISLSDLDAFYTINLIGQDKNQTLAAYIAQRFHRRVVIGDQVRLDQLLLTVRQVNEAGEAIQVGIKPVSD